MTLPGKMKLSTGVMVLYADEESFTLMTPQGHMFAGWITFSATEVEDETVAQAQVLMRASDPIFEIGLTMGGHKQEDRFWQHTLTAPGRPLRPRGRGGHPGRLRRQEAPVVEVAERLAQLRDPLDRSTRWALPAGREARCSGAIARLPDRSADAVVVGSGPNGLAAAIVLARAGRGDACSRARETIGGGLPLRGADASRASSTTPAPRSTPWRSPRRSCAACRSAEHGLELVHPDAPLAHPLDDGSAVILERSVEETAAGLGPTRTPTAGCSSRWSETPTS